MKKGDTCRGWDGWLCQIVQLGKKGTYTHTVDWITGPLAKDKPRRARVYDPDLKRVG